MPKTLPVCESLSSEELGFAPFCPYCGLKYMGGINWPRFHELEKMLAEVLWTKLEVISNIATVNIIRNGGKNKYRALVDAFLISSSCNNRNVIFTSSMANLIKEIIGLNPI